MAYFVSYVGMKVASRLHKYLQITHTYNAFGRNHRDIWRFATEYKSRLIMITYESAKFELCGFRIMRWLDHYLRL